MNRKFTVLLTAAVLLLGVAGSAGAQGATIQVLLPGAQIPKFVDPLPVAGQISVVNATSAGTPSYNIHMREFQSNILPTTTAIPANKKAGFNGLPAGTPSYVWGYLTDADVAAQNVPNPPVRASYLGPVVVAERLIQTNPTYFNELPNDGFSRVQPLLPIDQTLVWADPLGTGCANQPPTGACGNIYTGPQPAIPHIHGGEVAPAYDGGPEAWWTPGIAKFGQGFPGTGGAVSPGVKFTYPTRQQAGTIWFHDHALGATRMNVFAGMAGLYPITDPVNEPPQAGATCAAGGCLPKFPEYDIPLIIQDRSFDTAGQLFYNLASNPQPNPTVHPFWIPEFIGDSIVVNGRTWPYLAVEPRKYRFRIVNGSNARFYDLTLSNAALLTVIATDDGYLNAPVTTPNLLIAPGERYEVVIDFALAAGTNIIMMNSARTPFPGGGKVVPGTTDRVIQFRVNLPVNGAIADATLPANLRLSNPILDIKTPAVANKVVAAAGGACPPFLSTNTIVRQLTLNEILGPGGPLELVLNNTKFNGSTSINNQFGSRNSEQPAVGDTEIWEIINTTADAHPIHTHLASFQILNRQAYQATKWMNVYAGALAAAFPGVATAGQGPPLPYLNRNADCAIGGNPPIGPYLMARSLRLPMPYENGWKDTVVALPGEVTRIVIRWAETDIPVANVSAGNFSAYPAFDPTQLAGVAGYVWHCHIIDHEDNEMMRPYIVGATRQAVQ